MKDIFYMLLFLLKAAVIYLAFYFLAFIICSFTKYTGDKKTYFQILMANIICFLFFLIYGLLDNYYYVRINFLIPIWFFLFPLSFLLMVFFAFLFFFDKNVKPKK